MNTRTSHSHIAELTTSAQSHWLSCWASVGPRCHSACIYGCNFWVRLLCFPHRRRHKTLLYCTAVQCSAVQCSSYLGGPCGKRTVCISYWNDVIHLSIYLTLYLYQGVRQTCTEFIIHSCTELMSSKSSSPEPQCRYPCGSLKVGWWCQTFNVRCLVTRHAGRAGMLLTANTHEHRSGVHQILGP
jgi:hypothetical protein